MRLVIPTEVLADRLGHIPALALIKSAGFDCADFSLFDYSAHWAGADWREKALKIRDAAGQIGVTFCQAHTPFPTTRGEEPFDTAAFESICRSLEIAAILGVPRIVVHPVQHLPWVSNKKALFDASVALYRRLIPYCERWNIRVCAENMWQWDSHRGVITDSVCSQPEEFCALLDAVDSPWVEGCLDIGHCGLVGVDPAQAIRMMGKTRLKALHVHDVDYRRDCHTMPFVEDLDWQSITEALGQIDYEGEFTYEANEFLAKMPQELWEPAMKLMAATGRYLIDQVESKRIRG